MRYPLHLQGWNARSGEALTLALFSTGSCLAGVVRL